VKTFKHDLSFTNMATGSLGGIYPVGQVEILPNDILQIQSHGVVKFGTLVKDLKHRMKCKLVWTFSPIRQVLDDDDHWEDFITGGRDGNDATTLDTIATTTNSGAIQHYLGIGRESAGTNVLAYPLRCYSAFINNYIIDDEIQTEVAQDLDTVHYVNWQKNYFTTARTSPQLGTAVNITVGTRADVKGIGMTTAATWTNTTDLTVMDGSGSTTTHTTNDVANNNAAAYGGSWDVYADLANASGMSIDDFKLAMAANKFQENRAKYGARLVEYVKFLGGNIGDRLERPEIVSISSADVSISEIFNTNAGANYLGDQGGYASAGLTARRAVKWFPEHGYLTAFFWVIPEMIASEGIPRHFMRVDKEDFYTPEYANVMMQPIYKGELYCSGTTATDYETWGYTDNYRDYKEGRNYIAGDYLAAYDNEHLARQYGSLPTLNSAFLSTSGTIREADVFSQTTYDNVRWVFRHVIKGRRIVVPKTNFTFTRMS
jgi:hypothetical protein